MEKHYELLYASAMDDSDPLLVKEAFRIDEDKTMSREQKAEAIWKLFDDRRRRENSTCDDVVLNHHKKEKGK